MIKKPRKGLVVPPPPAPGEVDAARREFMLRLGGFGVAAAAAGILWQSGGVGKGLALMSRWNDKAQAALFDPTKMAKTYSEAEITRPFPFNAFYGEDEVPVLDGGAYRLELGGLVASRRAWTLAGLRALPQESQITRLICVEGWSAVGKWSGVPLHAFLRRIGADTTAKYVGFECADGYRSSIDMPSALHPQTILALDFDGQPLTPAEGYPMRLRIPTKLGFKNPKHITGLYVTNRYPGGYWEDQGYNWFSGL